MISSSVASPGVDIGYFFAGVDSVVKGVLLRIEGAFDKAAFFRLAGFGGLFGKFQQKDTVLSMGHNWTKK